MEANKIICGYRIQEKGMAPSVWVILRDAKIATIADKQEFFDTCMHHGCFIENLFADTRSECNSMAWRIAHRFGCRWVTPAEFRRIEAEGQAERASRALALAENMMKEG